MRISRLLYSLALLTFCYASPVVAQATTATALTLGGIDKLLERIESINIYFGKNLSNNTSRDNSRYRVPWSLEFGFEFGLHVGQYGRLTKAGEEKRTAAIQKLIAADTSHGNKLAWPTDSVVLLNLLARSFTASETKIQKHLTVNGRDTLVTAVDSVLTGNFSEPEFERIYEFDLGIGYGQLDGLEMATPAELRGYVRELPAVTVYASAKLNRHLDAYVGLRTGLISLQDANLFVPTESGKTTVVSLSATTFQIGFPFGVSVSLNDDVHLTLEAAYMRRDFNSLTYNPVDNLPVQYPHTVNVTGWSASLGVQFSIPKKAP